MAFVPGFVKRRLLIQATLTSSPLMHFAAFAVQPMVYLRRLSMRRGILGPSKPWRVVAVFAYAPGTLKKIFGREPEIITTETLRSPQFLSVFTAKPLTRRERKRTGITRKVLEKQAKADVATAKGVVPGS